jgi:aminomethyltransferase
MVDFAGWWMPVQYSSIVDEHLATRRAIGLFDVSHMGRLAIEGPAARDWLESLLTRRVSDIAVGQARYTLVTSDEGPDGLTILDDALVTREADAADGSPRFAMVVNASNRERVVAWLRSRLPATGVSFTDRTAETAMIAVQGPLAVATVCVLCGDDDAGRISGLGNYRATRAFVAGQPAAVSRTGYTGEDGVEVVVAAAVAEDVWQAIHDAGVPRGLAAFAQVGVVLQLAGRHAGMAGQEIHGRARQLLGRSGSVGRHVQLGAVAGGHQGRLGRRALQALAQGLEHGAQLVGRKGQTAPQIQRCGGVVQA